MKGAHIQLTMHADVVDRLDQERGPHSRSSWVAMLICRDGDDRLEERVRAIEVQLGIGQGPTQLDGMESVTASLPGDDRMSGYTIAISSIALPFVRAGAHDLIGDAIDAIAAVNDALDREDHPEHYQAPFAWLARIRALLDVIGWDTTVTIGPRLHLADHGTTLCEAVDNMLNISINALREAKASEHGRAKRRVRVLLDFSNALLDFGKDLDGAFILRSRNDPRVRALHKSADELLAELDAEGADYS
jgi:hypothetical protein